MGHRLAAILAAALLAGLLLLTGMGLVVLYSASGGDTGVVYRQAVRLGVGLVAVSGAAGIGTGLILERVGAAWTERPAFETDGAPTLLTSGTIVDGVITDCGRIAAEGVRAHGRGQRRVK